MFFSRIIDTFTFIILHLLFYIYYFTFIILHLLFYIYYFTFQKSVETFFTALLSLSSPPQ